MSMPWTSRQRQPPSRLFQSSSLEMDHRSYSYTFPRKRRSSLLDFVRSHSYPIWTVTSAVLCALLFYHSLHHSDSTNGYDTTPISVWNHNHYRENASNSDRNLLIAQVGQSRPFAEITSRPNRAYGRRWGWDYLMHITEKEDDACGTVKVLNHLLARQEREGKEQSFARAPYNVVLFLSPDAVIMDQDFQFLALLPSNKLVAANTEKANVFVWNLEHARALQVARLWLDLGEDSSCDMESLWAAVEASITENETITDYVQPLQLSETGLVEPRLIKFLPEDSQQNFPETMGLLESVADSVCYRYYPRCEVL